MKIASIKVTGYIDIVIPDHLNKSDITENWIRNNIDYMDDITRELDYKCAYITDWGENNEN